MQLFQLRSFVFFPFKKDQVHVPRECVSEVNKNKFFFRLLILDLLRERLIVSEYTEGSISVDWGVLTYAPKVNIQRKSVVLFSNGPISSAALIRLRESSLLFLQQQEGANVK